MSHFAIKLDLSKLKHVVRKLPKAGGGETTCIIIDGPSNGLFFADSGSVYLDLVAFENKEVKYDNTHSLKRSLGKEEREKMTAEEQKQTPFVGNMKPIGGQNNNSSNSAPSSGDYGAMPDFSNGSAPVENKKDPLDDLPF